jgi:flagellar assembly protein FliH
MSSRILRGAEAAPARWRAVEPAESVQALARSGGAPRARPAPAGGGRETAEAGVWEARLRAAQEEAEARIREAYERGRAEAGAAARDQARAALDPAIESFRSMAEELAAQRARVRREAEHDVVRLAVAIARRILRRELATDPEALLGVVKAAAERLNAREVLRLRVSPEDRERIAAHASRCGLPQALEIAGDRSLPAGSVVFETARGEYDASVETQLAEIERGFADRFGRR